MVANWLHTLAIISLVSAVFCAGVISVDILRGNKQQMGIMSVVWPVTTLWSGPLDLWAYFQFGRTSTHHGVEDTKRKGNEGSSQERPYAVAVAISATHCGAGCTLGDIIAEWVRFAAPFVIAGVALFGAWALDYAFAFLIGIAFQYLAIAPMRNLPFGKELLQALKADTLSLTAWQLGMYGWMGVMRFAVFRKEIPKTDAAFWFLMQLAMCAGFLTSYPVNWWLLKKGIKEEM